VTRRRIWELDALRGAAIAGMVIVHLIFDLTELTGLLTLRLPAWYDILKEQGGSLFLVISGISATLGSRSLKRGLAVFSLGMLCTAATAGLYLAGFSGRSIIIWFGALHCLGLCMVLWPALRHLSPPVQAAAGAVMTAAGLWARGRSFDVSPLLIPLGFAPGWFASSDYFPLLPNLGWFLLGAAAGRSLYPKGEGRLPETLGSRQPFALLCAMGRHSLIIYLLHQPLLAAAALGLSLIL